MLNLSLDTVSPWSVEITEINREQSWSANDTSTTANHRWVSYLNSLCLDLVQPLFDLEPDGLWPSAVALRRIWEVTTGSAIILGSHRLVIIPTEAIDASDLVVPQEWVDIPDWSGDYYVSVQINPDQSELQILGYTTHQLLKQRGHYDAFDRTYNFEGEDLIHWDSFNLVYACYSAAQTRGQIEPIADLSSTQAENLIERLGNPSEALPRLAIPFTQWGALLGNPDWRDRLFDARQGQSFLTSSVPSGAVRLSRWLQQQFETGWQELAQWNVPQTPSIAPRGRGKTRGEERTENEAEKEAIAEPTQYRMKRLVLSPQLQSDLMVGIAPLENGALSIQVKLGFSMEVQTWVEPVWIHLSDQDGTVFAKESTTNMELICIGFNANPGDQFLVEVNYGSVQHVEHFEV